MQFFKWFGNDIIDERDLKIERHKNKNLKLKNLLANTRRLVKDVNDVWHCLFRNEFNFSNKALV